eukprot:1357234-Amorphochlora_amoeboformis.AAC.1
MALLKPAGNSHGLGFDANGLALHDEHGVGTANILDREIIERIRCVLYELFDCWETVELSVAYFETTR